MPDRPSPLAWCHLATLAVAVAMCAWRFDVAATLLLCASGVFLILGRVSSAAWGDLVESALAGEQAGQATLDDALCSLSRHERRGAMLAELLADSRLAAAPALMTRCVAITRQLGDADETVDDALQSLRADMLRRPVEAKA